MSVWRWLLGLEPVNVVISALSQREIVERAEAALARETAARKEKGWFRAVLAETGQPKGTTGYVDGEWDTERLNLWLRHPGYTEGVAANLRATFEPSAAGAGTRVLMQVRLAPPFMAGMLGLSGIGLLILLIAAGRAIAGLGIGWLFIAGIALLVIGIVSVLMERQRLSYDVPGLRDFLIGCAEVGPVETAPTS